MSQPSQFASRVAPSKLATLNRLRKFSRLLDSAIGIPGTKFRFGLDPILGLIPGGGDFLGTILSAYLVIEAARLGLPDCASKDCVLGRVELLLLPITIHGMSPLWSC